ncbi:MAG: LptE family protein [Bacteroidota bacterium]|nr:LptE family protein [Bacteroidota bacterium]
MRKIFGWLIITAAAMESFSGCMYSFTGSSVPPHLKTIAVPLFEDQSGFGEPNLRENLTKEIIDQFVSDNSLTPADRSTSDSMLEGTITTVSDAPQVIAPGEQVSTRRVTITVHVTFQDLKLRKKVWEKNFTEYGDYEPGSQVRTAALTDAINKLANDVLLETVSGW